MRPEDERWRWPFLLAWKAARRLAQAGSRMGPDRTKSWILTGNDSLLHAIAVAQLADARAALEQARAEIARLESICQAAATEIGDHWQAHCDAEGYGPINLLDRLRGVNGGGYVSDAQRELVVRLRAALEQERAKVAELQELITARNREHREDVDRLEAAHKLSLDRSARRAAKRARRRNVGAAKTHGEVRALGARLDRIEAAVTRLLGMWS